MVFDVNVTFTFTLALKYCILNLLACVRIIMIIIIITIIILLLTIIIQLTFIHALSNELRPL